MAGCGREVKDTSLYGGVDWSRTRAFAQLRSAARLNLAGREPAGIVPPPVARKLSPSWRRVRWRSDSRPASPASPRSTAGPRSTRRSPGGPDLVMFPLHGLQIKSRNLSGAPGFLHRPDHAGTYLPSACTPMSEWSSPPGPGSPSGRCGDHRYPPVRAVYPRRHGSDFVGLRRKTFPVRHRIENGRG